MPDELVVSRDSDLMARPTSDQARGVASDRPVVAWRIRKAKPETASIRYRCLLPANGLKSWGWDSLILLKYEHVRDWSKVAALVIVKAFKKDDIALAKSAAAAGVPIIFDICDNIFADGVSGERVDEIRSNFKTITAICRAVTVTSPAMKTLIGPHLENPDLLRVIPDQVESQCDMLAALDFDTWRRDPRELRYSSTGRSIKRMYQDVKQNWKRSSLPRHEPAPPRTASRKRVVWFGSHGKQGESGLASLAKICPALARVHERLPIELLVVSDSAKKYHAMIEPFPFPTIYRDWHPLGTYDDIKSADLFVMPNSLDEYSVTKSANRALLAFSLGVPVVATIVPALEPLSEVLMFGDWEDEVLSALSDPAGCAERTSAAQTIVETKFGSSAIAAQWDAVLREAMGAEA